MLEEAVEGGLPPSIPREVSATRRPLRTVADSIDRAVVIVGDQQRAVLHDQHIDRPPDIIVVLDEAGDEWLHRLEGAVRFERHQDNITPDLGSAVPRS